MGTQQAKELSQKADVLRNQGQTGQAIVLYQKAADLFEAAGEQIKAIDTRYLLVSTCLHMEGKREEAVKLGEEAARRFVMLGAADLEGSAYVNIGIAFLNDGLFKEAEEWLKKALETLQSVESSSGPANFGIAHAKLGYSYIKQGRFDEAEHELGEALEILCKIGHWFFEHTARMHLAQLFFTKKDYLTALTHGRASLGILYEENALDVHQRRVAELKGIIARSYWELGNEPWGIRYLKDSAKLLNDMPDEVALIVCKNVGAQELLAQISERHSEEQININALIAEVS